MEKAVDAVKRNFATIRTGRANAGMLDRIMASRRRARGDTGQLATRLSCTPCAAALWMSKETAAASRALLKSRLARYRLLAARSTTSAP